MSSQVWVFEQVQPTLACIATEAIILTCLYNLHSLTRHFYIVKVGLTCVHFFIFALIHRMWLLIRAASLKEFYPVPTIYFLKQKKKNIYLFFYRQFLLL